MPGWRRPIFRGEELSVLHDGQAIGIGFEQYDYRGCFYPACGELHASVEDSDERFHSARWNRWCNWNEFRSSWRIVKPGERIFLRLPPLQRVRLCIANWYRSRSNSEDPGDENEDSDDENEDSEDSDEDLSQTSGVPTPVSLKHRLSIEEHDLNDTAFQIGDGVLVKFKQEEGHSTHCYRPLVRWKNEWWYVQDVARGKITVQMLCDAPYGYDDELAHKFRWTEVMDSIVDGPQMRLGDEEQWRNLPYVPEFGPFELYATREPVGLGSVQEAFVRAGEPAPFSLRMRRGYVNGDAGRLHALTEAAGFQCEIRGGRLYSICDTSWLMRKGEPVGEAEAELVRLLPPPPPDRRGMATI